MRGEGGDEGVWVEGEHDGERDLNRGLAGREDGSLREGGRKRERKRGNVDDAERQRGLCSCEGSDVEWGEERWEMEVEEVGWMASGRHEVREVRWRSLRERGRRDVEYEERRRTLREEVLGVEGGKGGGGKGKREEGEEGGGKGRKSGRINIRRR